MANIQINRIKSKLKEIFNDKVYMGNVTVAKDSKEFEKMWYSRAYSAYSTFLLGSESVDESVASVPSSVSSSRSTIANELTIAS